MGSRLELQELLESILGSRNVYYQPPESLKLNYPCIVYKFSRKKPIHADNKLYINRKAYQITIIDKRAESPIVSAIEGLSLCAFDNHFSADNLNHDVYTLYF